LEIFNFFRKFESNLKNRLSGSSVNNSKIKIDIAAYRRRHAATAAERFAPLSHALTRSRCRGGLERALSTPGNPFPAINSNSRRRRPRFPLLLCSATA